MSDRVCECCGAPLKPREKRWCSGSIIKTCPICNKEFVQKCRSHMKTWCSSACANKDPMWRLKVETTLLSRYGCKNPMQNAEIARKSRESQISRYGCLAFNTTTAKEKSRINSHTEEAHNKRRQSLARTYSAKQANGEPLTRFNTVSKMNKNFKKKLEDSLGLEFEYEYVVEECFFDLRCGNLLIDINPSVSHASNYSFNDLVKLHSGKPRPQAYHFERQRVAEEHGFELVQVFDFTKDPIDIIRFYAAKVGLCEKPDYNIKEIRFSVPQRHMDHHGSTELEVYDAGIYYIKDAKHAEVTDISRLDMVMDSYDVETESDRFDLSGVDSHNCRTRVVSNDYCPEKTVIPGRGNFAFTTINLPALGIRAEHSVPRFFELFDEMIDACIDQLKDRFEYISHKHAYNYPFLMGQGVYLDSDKLAPDDEIGEVIKHASLSVGFVGLAECLVALIGKHHGESRTAQKLGLDIIHHLRTRMDREIKKTGLNWSCFATPAEGLCSRAAKLNRKRFGLIPGVTDRDYITNSSH